MPTDVAKMLAAISPSSTMVAANRGVAMIAFRALPIALASTAALLATQVQAQAPAPQQTWIHAGRLIDVPGGRPSIAATSFAARMR